MHCQETNSSGRTVRDEQTLGSEAGKQEKFRCALSFLAGLQHLT
jgi:hypothetical protein